MASKNIMNTLQVLLTISPITCRDNDVEGMLCWLVPAHNPPKYAVAIQQPLILSCRLEDPGLSTSHQETREIWLIRCLVWYNGIFVPAGRIAAALFLPLCSLSEVATRPQLPSADPWQCFKHQARLWLKYQPTHSQVNKRNSWNAAFPDAGPINDLPSSHNMHPYNTSTVTKHGKTPVIAQMIAQTFRWVKTPSGPLKLSVYLLPPQPTKELVCAGTCSTISITAYLRRAETDGVIFNSVPPDSAQWAPNPGPHA